MDDGGIKADDRNEEDVRPGTSVHKRTNGDARSGKEKRVRNRPDRKTTRRKIGARAGEPGPNRRRAGKAGFVQPKHVPASDDRGRELTKPETDPSKGYAGMIGGRGIQATTRGGSR